MKTKIKLLKALVFAAPLFVFPVQAAVEVVGVSLGGLGPTLNYTVPAGKVLLVEHVSASYATNAPPTPRIILEVGLQVQNNAIATMRFGYPIPDLFTAVVLQRPLRVPAGRTIGIYFAGNAGYDQCRIQGLLVDAADLYAANIDMDLEAKGIVAGRFKAEATLSSARPARIKTRTSTDLTAFVFNASEQKSRLGDPRKWELFTAADSSRKFMVAKATAMEGR